MPSHLRRPNIPFCRQEAQAGLDGLGMAQHIDTIEVIWPDGTEERFSGCAADQIVVLRKGQGLGISLPGP